MNSLLRGSARLLIPLLVATVRVAYSSEAEPLVWRLNQLESVGGVGVTTLGKPRLVDGGIFFDGVQDGLLVPLNPLTGWREFTIEVLFEPAADGPAEQRFLHLEDSIGARALIETRLDGKGGWTLDTFLRTKDDQLTLLDRTKVHPTGRRAWAALRYDGKTMSAFLNAEKQVEGPVKFPPMVAGQTSIGVRQNKAYWFKGTIYEVRFTPAALADEKLMRVK